MPHTRSYDDGRAYRGRARVSLEDRPPCTEVTPANLDAELEASYPAGPHQRSIAENAAFRKQVFQLSEAERAMIQPDSVGDDFACRTVASIPLIP